MRRIHRCYVYGDLNSIPAQLWLNEEYISHVLYAYRDALYHRQSLDYNIWSAMCRTESVKMRLQTDVQNFAEDSKVVEFCVLFLLLMLKYIPHLWLLVHLKFTTAEWFRTLYCNLNKTRLRLFTMRLVSWKLQIVADQLNSFCLGHK
jgi:hypothetical protein